MDGDEQEICNRLEGQGFLELVRTTRVVDKQAILKCFAASDLVVDGLRVEAGQETVTIRPRAAVAA